MRHLRGSLGTATVALILGMMTGCGESPPSVDSSNAEATVKGVVKIGGVPATEGEIAFDPTNFKRPNEKIRTAPIGKDGTYSIKTLTGENVIRLGGAITKKNSALEYSKKAMMVNSGENTFDFEVGTDAKK